MRKTRIYVICIAVIAVVSMVPARPASAADEQERKLISVLESDAPPQEKAITCKHLAVYGSQDAVPAIAALLPDPQLSSWARIALEAITDPAADAALRDAMDRVEGRILVGVINSIAVRRDAGAVDRLIKRLRDKDASVAAAAAVALGSIGNDTAGEALQESLGDVPVEVRSAVAEGCILCAERRLAEGKNSQAGALYDLIRQADLPQQRILEAVRGAILARKAEGIPLLVEQLQSADKAFYYIGLTVARELDAPGVTDALAAELGKISPDRQALLLFALADRNDPKVLPTVVNAAGSGPVNVRKAAIRVLQRIGDVTCVPTLLGAAMESEGDLSPIAIEALEGLSGDAVNTELVARLAKSKNETRRILVELAGRRRIAVAVPELLRAADDTNAAIRRAALTALGETVDARHLNVLIARAIGPKESEDRQIAAKALRAAAVRMPNGEACAEQLIEGMAQAPVAAKCTVLEILGEMGGANALAAVGAAAKDEDTQLQDTASRLLGKWMSVDAAPVLLDLAKTAAEDKYKIRALRGYLRIVQQFIPEDQRAQMCRDALQVAQRDTERKRVLEILGLFPSVEMLKIAVEMAETPTLKNDAVATSLAIAQKLGGKNADVRKLLAVIGQEAMKVEIIKAEYGAGSTLKDVTKTLQQHVRGLPLIVLPSSSYNAALGGDPVPGVVKQLKIQYRINGKAGEISLSENAPIILPIPK